MTYYRCAVVTFTAACVQEAKVLFSVAQRLVSRVTSLIHGTPSIGELDGRAKARHTPFIHGLLMTSVLTVGMMFQQ